MTTKPECITCSSAETKGVTAKDFCIGCKSYFCVRHFREHETQLAHLFLEEVVQFHNHLLNQLSIVEKQSEVSSTVFNQIERWEIIAKEALTNATKSARDKFINSMNTEQMKVQQELQSIAAEIRDSEGEKFLEDDIELFKLKLGDIKKSLDHMLRIDTGRTIIVVNDNIDWSQMICIQDKHQLFPLRYPCSLAIPISVRWRQDGVTVAGGNGNGHWMNQLSHPTTLYIDDDDKSLYVVDHGNHRIMKWERNAISGQVVAGGNGEGSGVHQLSKPEDVILDKKSRSLLICDRGNRRIVRWPLQSGAVGEIVISDIDCRRFTMDETGCLYIVDSEKHEVRRYETGALHGTVVAGGNGRGNRLDQLDDPSYVFVDQDHSVYVSDCANHRVMKWVPGAREVVVMAGGNGQGGNLNQLSRPEAIVVDQMGTLYVADGQNARVMCWANDNRQKNMPNGGAILVERRAKSNYLIGLSFDRDGNLYVVDMYDHRVLRFDLMQ